MFRSYPAGAKDGGYDPRLRPWYTIAANGPKDVVVVVDVSGSMSSNNRMDLTKNALKALVESLAPTDRLGLVEFSSSSEVSSPAVKWNRALSCGVH